MKEKCHHKVLHKAPIGSVSLCDACGCLRVEIGNLVSLISAEPFQLILNDFQERRAFYDKHRLKNKNNQPILICLNNNNLYLKLTEQEFDEVLDLFEMANHMLQVNALMSI